MIPHAVSEIPERGIVIFDAAGNRLAWDSSKTMVEGRTLTLQLATAPTAGRPISSFAYIVMFLLTWQESVWYKPTIPMQIILKPMVVTSSDPADNVTTVVIQRWYGEYQVQIY